MKCAIFPMTVFTQLKSGKRTDIYYYVDSSCLPVSHLKRSRRHKTFNRIAQYGRTSVGWFFGLKLHIVTNDRGELIAFKITKGNRSDSQEAAKKPFINAKLKSSPITSAKTILWSYWKKRSLPQEKNVGSGYYQRRWLHFLWRQVLFRR